MLNFFKHPIFMISLGIFCWLGAALAHSYPAYKQHPIIIDTDMAQDDWMAILYLAKHPKVKLLALTVPATGEAHCKPGVQNAQDLLKMATLDHRVPVACGPLPNDPMIQPFPDDFRDAADKLFDIKVPHSNVTPHQDAIVLLRDTLLHAKKPVDVLALGPLTNLAQLFSRYPETIKKVRRLYIMGGAIYVPGNISESTPTVKNDTAEWNFFVDANAVQAVLNTTVPVTLISLDSTNAVPLTPEFIKTFVQAAKTPAAKFVAVTLDLNKNFAFNDLWYFWDPLAASVMINPHFSTVSDVRISINTTGPIADLGRCVIDDKARKVQYISQVYTRLFKDDFIKILNHPETHGAKHS